MINRLKPLWGKATGIGITEDLNFEDRKKIRLLNLIALYGLPAAVFFAAFNTYKHHIPLVYINVLLALGCISLLFINKKRKYLAARLLLSVLSILVFSVAATYYKNGGEYFLLLNIVATAILFKRAVFVISVSAVNAIVFIGIKLNQLGDSPFGQGHSYGVIFNISWALLFMISALYYYKAEHLSYQKQIEDSNLQLKEQQELLLLQKAELEKKSNELQLLNHTKEKLFSVIAHDMRSPIAGLKTSLDLFHEGVIDQNEFQILVHQLSEQVNNINSNLDNLLQWSYGQLNGIQVQPGLVALKPIVLQTIALLLENARQKHVAIEQHIPEDLFVFADPEHVKVIMRNLLSNAIKYSHFSGIIEVSAAKQDFFATIMVRDVGVGMNEVIVSQLFKANKLSTKPGTRNEKGTGLGLILCKEFVEKNNGRLKVESEEGKGTCFSFTLPLGK